MRENPPGELAKKVFEQNVGKKYDNRAIDPDGGNPPDKHEGVRPAKKVGKINRFAGSLPMIGGLGAFIGDNLRTPTRPAAVRDAQTAVTPAEAAARATEIKLGTEQVNTEQPTTGGKVEPDERDGTRQ